MFILAMNTNKKIVKTPTRGADGFYSPIGARMPIGTDLAKDVLYSAIRAGVSNDTLARLATDLHDNIRAASDAYSIKSTMPNNVGLGVNLNKVYEC